MITLVKTLFFSFVSFVCLLIAIKSFDYASPNFEKGYLVGKGLFFIGTYKIAFYAHIICSPILILVSIFQLNSKKQTQIHKLIGKLFVLITILVLVPSGFVLGCHAIGGLQSEINFYLLSSLLLVFALKSYLHIKALNIIKHQEYMNRVFILLLSAIFTRLFLFISSFVFNISSEFSYSVIVWLSWLPFLIGYELFLVITKNNNETRNL